MLGAISHLQAALIVRRDWSPDHAARGLRSDVFGHQDGHRRLVRGSPGNLSIQERGSSVPILIDPYTVLASSKMSERFKSPQLFNGTCLPLTGS